MEVKKNFHILIYNKSVLVTTKKNWMDDRTAGNQAGRGGSEGQPGW